MNKFIISAIGCSLLQSGLFARYDCKDLQGQNGAYCQPHGKQGEIGAMPVPAPFNRNLQCKKENKRILEITVPPVQAELFDETYSVGGNRICLPVKIVPKSELGEGAEAQWRSDEGVIAISEADYRRYQEEKLKGSKKDNAWDGELVKTLRHEAIHAMVDAKYKKIFADENGKRVGEADNYYHFMSEMLAYMGEHGWSAEQAAEQICKAHKKWPEMYAESYDIADKFLKGEKYTPPHVARKYESAESVPVPRPFDRDLQCKKEDRSEVKACQDVFLAVEDRMRDFKMPDLSKLFGVMKRIIECLRKIDAMSSKPSDGDFAEYNKLAGKCAEEAVAIAKVIEDEIGKMNLTEEEKIKFGKKIGEQIEKRYGEELKTYSSTIKSLQKQIEAKGYGDFKTTNIGLDFKAKYLN